MCDGVAPADILKWLNQCLATSGVQSSSARSLKNGSEREVWDCDFRLAGTQTRAILTVFKPGPLESVNTSLPPDQAARKCALAMAELPAFGIPTPQVLGHAISGREAALLCEKVKKKDWTPDARIEAAEILARIHTLKEPTLSGPLRELARISDPREYRTTGGEAPSPKARTLVHGDYLSVNILRVRDGLRIIDWETFGWGDPMWDLGFLVGADRNIPYDEIEATIAAYEKTAPVDREQLNWHQRRWSDNWKQRDRRPSNKTTEGDVQ